MAPAACQHFSTALPHCAHQFHSSSAPWKKHILFKLFSLHLLAYAGHMTYNNLSRPLDIWCARTFLDHKPSRLLPDMSKLIENKTCTWGKASCAERLRHRNRFLPEKKQQRWKPLWHGAAWQGRCLFRHTNNQTHVCPRLPQLQTLLQPHLANKEQSEPAHYRHG